MLLKEKPVRVEIKENVLYSTLVHRIGTSADVLILSSSGIVPGDTDTANQLGPTQLVCGVHPAFVPASVKGEEREAAEMYVKFFASSMSRSQP